MNLLAFMSDSSKNQQHTAPKKPPIRLPFQGGRGDIGMWSYSNRRGICVTLIAYLVFAIVFVGGGIKVGQGSRQGEMIIDFGEQPKENRELLTPEEIRILNEHYATDFSDVRNLTSNEGGSSGSSALNANLGDDRGTQASEIYDNAGGLDDQMRANKEAYEAGLSREQAILSGSSRQDPKTGSNTGTVDGEGSVKVKGLVTVSFSFKDPVRNSLNLVVPAYMCEGGGEVLVNVTLDINGYATAVSVDKSVSSSNECMQNTAIYAARSSRFNVDRSAPAKHRGTISYIFIPQ